jgi:YceI-like domain
VISAALLDARSYPEITFTGRRARRDGDGWVVPGSVTAHGAAIPAEVRLGGVRQEAGETRFLATARPDRTSFGITKKRGHGRAHGGPGHRGGRPAGLRSAGTNIEIAPARGWRPIWPNEYNPSVWR